jgi:hypothetical protein
MKKIVIETAYTVKHRYFIEAESEEEAVNALATGDLKHFDYKVLSEDIVGVKEVSRWRDARPPGGLTVDHNNENGSVISNHYVMVDGKAVHHIGNTVIFD